MPGAAQARPVGHSGTVLRILQHPVAEARKFARTIKLHAVMASPARRKRLRSRGWSEPRTCSQARSRSARAHPAANRLVRSTRPTRRLPLKCHSPEGGTRFQVRKKLTTRSPLTESNRRPSPYHVSLCSSAPPGRSSDLREHEHTLALTSAGRAHASVICHSICHSL